MYHSQAFCLLRSLSASSRLFTGSSITARSARRPVIEPPTPAAKYSPPLLVSQEAAHPSIWVAGGRPLFLWVGGVGFGYAVILQPLLAWFALIKGWPVPPVPNIDLLWVVVSGLLGISGFRTVEKVKGVTK